MSTESNLNVARHFVEGWSTVATTVQTASGPVEHPAGTRFSMERRTSGDAIRAAKQGDQKGYWVHAWTQIEREEGVCEFRELWRNWDWDDEGKPVKRKEG